MATGKPGVEQPKRKVSTGLLILAGCGTVLVLGFLACAGLIGWGVWYGVRAANEFAEPFEGQGYERVEGQQVTERKTIDGPRIYVAQQVIIRDGAKDDIALAVQMAELSGTFEGDIDFLGQILHIKPDAIVKGDIRIKAGQVIQVEGVVEGKISGSYQVLDDKRRTVTDVAEPSDAGEAEDVGDSSDAADAGDSGAAEDAGDAGESDNGE